MNYSKIVPAVAVVGVLFLLAAPSHAQAAGAAPPSSYKTDIAFSYTAEHANPVGGGGNFWLQGGSAEVCAMLWRGLGIAGNFTVTHSSSVGPQNVSLGLMTYTFGPRYRRTLPYMLRGKQTSIFGEVLVGGVKGFDSIFPNSTGATHNAYSLAVQAGGGIDVKLRQHISLRPVEASWVRMQLPNSTSNSQNDLRLSTGLVYSF